MKIQIGEKEITLEHITINQYRKLLSDPDIKDINFISLLTGVSIAELRDVEYNQITFVSQFLRTWMNSLQETPLSLVVEYKGEKLGLVQPKNISYGEFSDLHILTSQENMDYELISSILYRPLIEGEGEDRVIQKYDYDECVRRSKDFGDFPMNDYISSIFFFVKYYELLLEDSHLSSGKKRKGE